MLYPTLLAYLYIVALPAAGTDPRAVQATWLGGKALECVFPLLWLRWLEGRWPRPAAPTRRGLGLGIGSGVAIAALLLLPYFGVLRQHHLFGSAPARVHQKVAEFGLDAPAAFVVFAVLLSVVHSLLEEYYWRWFVFGRLQRLLPVSTAVLLASAAFMAFHLI